jgi:hypothetical protein
MAGSRAMPDRFAEVDERLALDRAYARLSPEQAITVVLRYHADLTLEDVADRMGVPVGTVKSRLHAALAAMRLVLTGLEVDYEHRARTNAAQLAGCPGPATRRLGSTSLGDPMTTRRDLLRLDVAPSPRAAVDRAAPPDPHRATGGVGRSQARSAPWDRSAARLIASVGPLASTGATGSSSCRMGRRAPSRREQQRL